MDLKSPALLDVPVKFTRGLNIADGLAELGQIVDLRPLILQWKPVTANQETPVEVSLSWLPPNANIKAIHGTLWVRAGEAGPPPEPAKVGISEGNGPERSLKVRVDARQPGLQSVQLRLNGGEAFWNFPGQLPPGEHRLPDFSPAANAFLDASPGSGSGVTFKFLITSMAAAEVALEIRSEDLEYSLLQTQSWPNQLDGSLRLDRNITASFNAIETFVLDELRVPAGRRPLVNRLRLDFGGQVDPERVLGTAPRFDGHQTFRLNSETSLGQGLILESGPLAKKAARLTGLVVFLLWQAESEVYLELQPDAGQGPEPGQPRQAAPLGKVNLSLAAPAEAQKNGAWVYAALETPVEMAGGAPFWAVLKGVRGEVQVGLTGELQTGPVNPFPALLNRGGQLWRPLVRPTAGDAGLYVLLNPVFLPAPDQQSAAVVMVVQAGPTLPANPGSAPTTLEFELGGKEMKQLVLELHCAARGTLSLANLAQEFRLA